jgi:8-oxo-dGTP diphosphatase
MPRREFRPNEVSAGGVVVRHTAAGPQICLVFDGRHWGLPKGNVERGERPEDAALREIHEEVGLPVHSLRLGETLPPSDYVYRRQGRLIFKRVHQYVVETVADAQLTPDGREIMDAGWLSPADAKQRASFEDTRRAIDAAVTVLGVNAAPGT